MYPTWEWHPHCPTVWNAFTVTAFTVLKVAYSPGPHPHRSCSNYFAEQTSPSGAEQRGFKSQRDKEKRRLGLAVPFSLGETTVSWEALAVEVFAQTWSIGVTGIYHQHPANNPADRHFFLRSWLTRFAIRSMQARNVSDTLAEAGSNT
jgi:hypothetical protein